MENRDYMSSEARKAHMSANYEQRRARYERALTTDRSAEVSSTLPSVIQTNLIAPDTYLSAPHAQPPSYSCHICCGFSFHSPTDFIRHIGEYHRDVYSSLNNSMPQPYSSGLHPPLPPSQLPPPPFLHPHAQPQPAHMPSVYEPAHVFPSAPHPRPTQPITISQNQPQGTPQLNPSPGELSQHACDICNVQCCNQQQLDCHFSGGKHRKRAERHAAFATAAQTFRQHGICEVTPGFWNCANCHSSMDTANSVLQHLESVKHRRFMESAGIPIPAPVTQEPATNPPPPGQTPDNAHVRMEEPMTALRAACEIPLPAGLSESLPTYLSPPCKQSEASMPVPASTAPLTVTRAHSATGLRPIITKPARTPVALANVVATASVALAAVESSQPVAKSFSCSACSIVCNSLESLRAHSESARHVKKVQAGAACPAVGSGADGASVLASSSAPASVGGRPEGGFHCLVCNISCCGEMNYEAHLKGRLHMKKLKASGQTGGQNGNAGAGSTGAGTGGSSLSASSCASAPLSENRNHGKKVCVSDAMEVSASAPCAGIVDGPAGARIAPAVAAVPKQAGHDATVGVVGTDAQTSEMNAELKKEGSKASASETKLHGNVDGVHGPVSDRNHAGDETQDAGSDGSKSASTTIAGATD